MVVVCLSQYQRVLALVQYANHYRLSLSVTLKIWVEWVKWNGHYRWEQKRKWRILGVWRRSSSTCFSTKRRRIFTERFGVRHFSISCSNWSYWTRPRAKKKTMLSVERQQPSSWSLTIHHCHWSDLGSRRGWNCNWLFLLNVFRGLDWTYRQWN